MRILIKQGDNRAYCKFVRLPIVSGKGPLIEVPDSSSLLPNVNRRSHSHREQRTSDDSESSVRVTAAR